ncbi:hypothetical protein L3Y34_009759 [Caenorhabditis briggsae]|uniref:F-box domain-containing protein n=1 Tax=Caenorhabditis briggsae TaxID=6238 RepID=A0AAE9D3D0_CAEBR|nr:hypothetical protein L3Y34_009759 [Caenorhabditis briggsae]
MKLVQIPNTVSLKIKNLQKQLFFALVFQAMVPIILMHIPVTILYTCSLLDIIFRLPVESTIALFPALDPFPTIFIVKSYRNTILEMTTPPNLEDMPDVVLSNIFEKTGISGILKFRKVSKKFGEFLEIELKAISANEMILVAQKFLSSPIPKDYCIEYLDFPDESKFSDFLGPQNVVNEENSAKWTIRIPNSRDALIVFQSTEDENYWRFCRVFLSNEEEIF